MAFRPLRGPLLNSPYSDGEKDAVIDDFANCQRCRKGAGVASISFLPVIIRGEGGGSRMRGGANLDQDK
ncbi:MAG: hypothetical protein EOS56_21305 [Mesorhizobium sp.]|nr:MAG: hypothetical protein EOS55_17160 [Mesorhizobium sp.]RWC57644.1 MAG: hypothetical protein EOS56_21305 [Mesorhizobium sp.]RWC66609.1 MAG: hypothetical protein EOS29_04410 [Mesorhizobium sp.]